MATAVLTCPLEPLRPATPPAPPSTAATATAAADRGPPAPVPNKHLPFCSPGPRPATRTCGPSRPASASPPPSPAPPRAVETSTLTHPPTGFDRVCHHPAVYAITADQLSHALDHLSSQPLPPPAHVFPWLHGLHADNQLQLAFFAARQKSPRRTPSGLRGIAVVKAGGDLSQCRIRGAVAPEELLRPVPPVENSRPAEEPEFWDADPPDGFSVRNFHIQTCKMAAVSDIVVYGDEKTPREEAARLAQSISNAQALWQQKTDGSRHHASRSFNTFLLSADWTTIECDYPDLVQVDSEGCATGKVTDFFHWERREMCSMSAPREIAPNVWMGPTPDPVLQAAAHGLRLSDHQQGFDILVECSDTAHIPDAHALQRVEGAVERRERSGTDRFERAALHIEFPGSGAIMPPTWSQAEVDGLLAMCQWIHKQAHRPSAARKRRDSKLSSLTPPLDADGDSIMQRREPRQAGRKLLIHCTDGYTETSLLGLAYYMYANCLPVHAAWVELHREKGRNFFAYSSDVHLLRALQPRILHASPKHTGHLHSLCTAGPEWLDKMDGSLPSRILPYMYLGNLGHANNPGLLKELDIGQILSVGEAVTWPREVMDEWPPENLMFIDQVQDNGVDPLTDEFGRCLEFIGKGRRKGIKTLVHCRVGVSRSATICIAEVMSELDLSLPRAYCFVRARRLNVIIQPHLRFAYELLKWEEVQCQKRGRPLRRELEWATIAREIAALNQPYSRQG